MGPMLNQNAAAICWRIADLADMLRIEVHAASGRPTLIDCGIAARGGLEAGRLLAEVCMAGLGEVQFVPGRV